MAIMEGQAEPVQIAALLTALAVRGETADELAGAAEVMRAKVTPVRCEDRDAIDTCGTGGDGISTFNISTTAAIIASAAGVTVAKHGNRTSTRSSGSADVLQVLGVKINADLPVLERCLNEIRLAFLYAPGLHPAMKHAAPIRRALSFRTLFNLLGPLTSPARVRRQIIGCPSLPTAELVAQTLARLENPRCVQGWVIAGAGGLCDLSLCGENRVYEVQEGQIQELRITPADVGLAISPVEPLLIANVAESAAAVRDVLAGQPGPRREIAVLNAAAALVVAGKVANLPAGLESARQTIDEGRAKEKLEQLVRLTNA